VIRKGGDGGEGECAVWGEKRMKRKRNSNIDWGSIVGTKKKNGEMRIRRGRGGDNHGKETRLMETHLYKKMTVLWD